MNVLHAVIDKLFFIRRVEPFFNLYKPFDFYSVVLCTIITNI